MEMLKDAFLPFSYIRRVAMHVGLRLPPRVIHCSLKDFGSALCGTGYIWEKIKVPWKGTSSQG